MPSPARRGATLLVLLALPTAAALRAQGPGGDGAAPFAPKRPETRQELDRREAVKLYGQAVLAERQSRLLEATRLHEQAARLDPEAAAPLKALATLYLALDRLDDALAVSKKATDLDPADFSAWHLYARQLRARDRHPEAAAALTRALAAPGLKDRPERHAQIAFDLGTLYENLQELDKAEAAFREVAGVLDNPAALAELGDFSRDEIAAQAADTYERLGRVCVRAGKPDRAVEYFLKARERVRDKDPARARRLAYNLAEVRMARKEWAAALRDLDEFLDTLPQGTEAYRAKIKALEQLGRRDEVVPALSRHAARDRHNVALKLLLAEQYAAEDFAAAERLYLEVTKTAPGPDVYRGLFKLYAGAAPAQFDRVLGLLEEALGASSGGDEDDAPGDADAAARARSMLAVLRENPDLVRGVLGAAEGRGGLNRATSYYLGILAARARQLDAAERLFRGSLPQDLGRGFGRRNNQMRGLVADAYDNLLRVLEMAHKHEEVIELCRDGVKVVRNIYPDYFRRRAAQALSRLGRHAEALAEANLAVEVSPDDRRFGSRLTRVHVLSRAGQHDKAVAECEEMLKQYTKAGEQRQLRHELSTAFSHARQYARAEEQLKALLREDPDDAWACNDLGYFYAEQGKNLDEAEVLIRRALELDRRQRATGVPGDAEADNAAYVDSLGWVLFRRGRLAEARRELERATAVPGGAEDPVVWDHLGDVYSRQGEADRALKAYRKAVHLFEAVRSRPKDDHYRELKQKLELLERQP